jgi:transcriptional regulator with XRE-family HTH domain
MSRVRGGGRAPVTHGELVAETLSSDSEFRTEWERLAPARKLAVELIRYRAEHDLSQTALSGRLGVSQPRVAKLESGEHNPDFETIAHIVQVTGLEFCFDFVPEGRKSKLTTKRAREQAAATAVYQGVSVIAAAA